MPWWISGLSLFMSFFSVGTFVVWGSIAYGSGLAARGKSRASTETGEAPGWQGARRENIGNI